jgi:hypothetical protein
MLRSGVCPALTAALVVQVAVLPVCSQGTKNAQSTQQPTSSAQTSAPKKPKSAAQADLENYFQKFKKPMTMPDVPDMGGLKFRFGLERKDGSTVIVGQRFGTTSSGKDVIDFYKNGLVANKWKLTATSSTKVDASKAGATVNIMLMPKSSMDVKTDFMVNYSYSNRSR